MLNAQNLSKAFGSNLAVDDVSFTVEKGEVLGFLGPNGAGKSTSMRIVTGYLRADAGKVTIGGHDIETAPLQAKSLFGYLPENAPLPADMTVIGFLKFIAALRGLSGRRRAEAVEEVVSTCFLEPVLHQTVDTLSKGYRHRTCFASSIIHDPDLLIMDEPTDGLDPNQKHEIRNLIKRMGTRKAIVLSTHILEEVDAVCTRVIIINDGRLVADGLPSELRSRSKLFGAVTLNVGKRTFKESRALLEGLQGAAKVLCLDEDDSGFAARVFPSPDGRDDLAKRVAALALEGKWELSELHTEDGRLDEVFRAITTNDGNGE